MFRGLINKLGFRSVQAEKKQERKPLSESTRGRCHLGSGADECPSITQRRQTSSSKGTLSLGLHYTQNIWLTMKSISKRDLPYGTERHDSMKTYDMGPKGTTIDLRFQYLARPRVGLISNVLGFAHLRRE